MAGRRGRRVLCHRPLEQYDRADAEQFGKSAFAGSASFTDDLSLVVVDGLGP